MGKSGENWRKWGKVAILDSDLLHSRSSMAVSIMNLIRALVLQLRETQALFFSKWPPVAILDSDFCQNR